ncbi:MAG: hypothetical protein HFJ33_07490 [Clostridia bacterium]|nr:hypothetical protein [Clostridia bacterium]
MNRKQIIEQIRKSMPDFQGNEEEKEVKKALYIYIQLGKIKSFDEKYYFGNSETRRKIYRLAERAEKNIEEVASKRKIICVSLTYLFCNILKDFGIYAIASEAEDDGHVNPIIVTKSKKAFVADLQLDLENIQTKSRLEHFEYLGDSPRGASNSDQKKLTKMLIEMGYIKGEEDYKNVKIAEIKEKIENKNPNEALEIILEEEGLYDGNEDMQIVEINKFYKGTFKKLIPQFLGKKVFVFNCYKENQEKQKDYTICVFSEEDTIRPYLFSKKERRFLRVEISKMKQLEEEGLRLGVRPKENGVKKLQKYINQQMEVERNLEETK